MPSPVTINDVAARVGVAISSVSSALNGRPGVSDATRERIVAAAQELGYVPSVRGRSLSGKRTFAVGLVIHRDPDVLEMDPFFGGFINGIESYIGDRDYALVLQMSPNSAVTLEHYRRLAGGRRVDGVFLNELEVDDPRVELVQELGLPAIAVNPDLPFPLPSVRQDSQQAIADLVRHLVDLGHRSIGFVEGAPQFIHSRQRKDAWISALRQHGLTPGPSIAGDFTYQGGIEAAAIMLGRSDRPSAVMCANDLSAMGFMAQAQHMGFAVPRDLSITGFDGIEMSKHIRPALTTIQTQPREIGYAAATILMDLIDSGSADEVTIAPAAVVVRASSGEVPFAL